MDKFTAVRATLEILYFVSQIAILVVALVAARYAYKQTQAFGSLEITKIVQDHAARNARRVVITELKDKPYDKWTKEDKAAAALAGAIYDTMGVLLMRGFSDPRIFLASYASSIQLVYNTIKPYMSEVSETTKNDPGYWLGLEWLHAQCQRYHRISFNSQRKQ